MHTHFFKPAAISLNSREERERADFYQEKKLKRERERQVSFKRKRGYNRGKLE